MNTLQQQHLQRRHLATTKHSPLLQYPLNMSSARAVTALARSQPTRSLLSQRIAASTFSTSAHRPASTSGPPPQGFRTPPPTRWNEKKESVFDQASNYFLLTEMMRGMYVVLEQFFRPP